MVEPTNRMIYVTFAREGIHRYPAAATDPALESVRWLANEHRHMFHFKVAISVEHLDREIEFIIFKRWVQSLYGDGTLQLDFKSCEMIASDLYAAINARYPNRTISIDVSEDGENGAWMMWKS